MFGDTTPPGPCALNVKETMVQIDRKGRTENR